MNFRQRSSDFERRNNRKRFFPLVFVLLACFILIFSFSGPRNLLFGVASPLWHVKNSIGSLLSFNTDLLRSKSDLIAENNALKQQIQDNAEAQLLTEITQKENDDLKAIVNRKNYDKRQTLGVILEKPYLSAFDTLIIDIGTQNNISAGDLVLAGTSTYIGYISEVYDTTSKVTLYSSAGQKVHVLVGKNNIEKEAIGLGGGNFSVEMPVGSDVKAGDTVVIPSISPNIFGTVERVEFKETDSFEKVLFKTPVNIFELKWVLVEPDHKK